jgi:hypothetical protein
MQIGIPVPYRDPREVTDISETGEATLTVNIGDNGDPVHEQALAEKILKSLSETPKPAS